MADRRYHRIQAKFWTDEVVRTWDDDAKFLALYLISSPHTNLLGCFVVPKLYIMADLAWSEKQLEKPFAKLLAAGFLRYDSATGLLLIVNYLRHNPLENPNQVTAAVRKLDELPTSPLLEELWLLLEQLGEPLLQPLMQQLAKRYGKSGTTTATTTGTGEEREREAPSPQPPDPVPSIEPRLVAEIWNQICGDVLPKCSQLTEKRRQHVRARLHANSHRGADWWRGYFARIRASPFCCGENDRSWRATFDFAIRSEDVVASVLEGKYDRARSGHGSKPDRGHPHPYDELEMRAPAARRQPRAGIETYEQCEHSAAKHRANSGPGTAITEGGEGARGPP